MKFMGLLARSEGDATSTAKSGPLGRIFETANEVEIIASSGLFDEVWYRERYHPAGNAVEHYVRVGSKIGADPHPLFDTPYYIEIAGRPTLGPDQTALGHFVTMGGPAGLSPQPLFDVPWYRGTYPEAASRDQIAFRDYVTRGHKEFLAPHPLFDPEWYYSQVPGLREQGINPLTHFVEIGATEFRGPNALFDTAWYTTAYRSQLVKAAEGTRHTLQNPLVHYVLHADKQPLLPAPIVDLDAYRKLIPDAPTSDVEAYALLVTRDRERYERARSSRAVVAHVATRFSMGNKVCEAYRPEFLEAERLAFFAVNNPEPELTASQRALVSDLQRRRFEILVINSNPKYAQDFSDNCIASGFSCLVRDDHGRDFASWASAYNQVLGQSRSARTLLLLNDSVYGPLRDMNKIMQRAEDSRVDCYALTDSYESGYHLQSYFLFFSNDALQNASLKRFFAEYPMPNEKSQVIQRGEIALGRAIVKSGLKYRCLAPYHEVVAAWVNDYREKVRQFQRLLRSQKGAMLSDEKRLKNRGYAGYSLDYLSNVFAQVMRGQPVNPTTFFWDTLIRKFDFPYVKRELLALNPAGIPNLHELQQLDTMNPRIIDLIIDDMQRAGFARTLPPPLAGLLK